MSQDRPNRERAKRSLESYLKDSKALAHNMLSRYEMGIGDPTHRMKLLDKLRRLRENLDVIEEIVGADLYQGGYHLDPAVLSDGSSIRIVDAALRDTETGPQ